MTGPAPAVSADGWGWLEPGIVSGEVLIPATIGREWIFDAVRAERDGEMTRRLLGFAIDARAPVRRTTFELLRSLSFQRPGWPAVAGAAEAALRDADVVVRRLAAAVLVDVAEPERALAALDGSADPVVRVALVRAMLRRRMPVPGRLRSDPVPAVRLLANTVARPLPDAAIRADLEASIGVLDAPGEWWAGALAAADREQDCYAWVERLASPSVRREGVRMAVHAMRVWRAAPGRLAPVLARLVPEEPAALRALASSLTASRAAADVLAAAMDDPDVGGPAATALGCAGDHRAVPHLVRLLEADSDEPRLMEAFRAVAAAGADPREPVAAARQILEARPVSCSPERPMRVLAAFGPGSAPAVPELVARLAGAENEYPDLAFHVLGRIGPAAAAAVPLLRYYDTPGTVLARLRITSDRAVGERYLDGLPGELRRGRLAAAVLTWLAGHGGLTARQHAQLRSLFRRPGFDQVESAGAVWLHEGPSAAGELLEVLPQYLDDDLHAPKVLEVFAAMGPHARPVLGRLDRFVHRRHRAGFNVGDEDAEMRADETLLAATVAARERIAGQPGTPPGRDDHRANLPRCEHW